MEAPTGPRRQLEGGGGRSHGSLGNLSQVPSPMGLGPCGLLGLCQLWAAEPWRPPGELLQRQLVSQSAATWWQQRQPISLQPPFPNPDSPFCLLYYLPFSSSCPHFHSAPGGAGLFSSGLSCLGWPAKEPRMPWQMDWTTNLGPRALSPRPRVWPMVYH